MKAPGDFLNDEQPAPRDIWAGVGAQSLCV